MEWKAVYYNGLETNIEVTKCGRIRKIQKDWYGKGKGSYQINYGEIDLNKLKLDNGYLKVWVQVKGMSKKNLRVHQLVAQGFLNYEFSMYPEYVVHHKKLPKLNNHIDNLEVVTFRQNCSEERTLKSGLPVGVCYNKVAKKYQANITINLKLIHLGLFETIEEASNAYQTKLKSLSIR